MRISSLGISRRFECGEDIAIGRENERLPGCPCLIPML
jgi:hypothetical protein